MNINVHLDAHVRVDQGAEFMMALDRVVQRLEVLGEPVICKRRTMALSVAEQAIVTRFADATTKISDKIDALIANSGNLDDAEFNAQLQLIADGLDALGTPAVPIPGPGPQPTP